MYHFSFYTVTGEQWCFKSCFIHSGHHWWCDPIWWSSIYITSKQESIFIKSEFFFLMNNCIMRTIWASNLTCLLHYKIFFLKNSMCQYLISGVWKRVKIKCIPCFWLLKDPFCFKYNTHHFSNSLLSIFYYLGTSNDLFWCKSNAQFKYGGLLMHL